MRAEPILIGVVVAAIVSLVVRRLRRRRRGYAPARGRLTTGNKLVIAGGIAMMVASVVVGLWLLGIEQAPSGERPSIGIRPPGDPKPGRGFLAGMGVDFKGCGDPVAVKLVVAGSADYWRDNASKLRGESEFLVAIPDRKLKNVRVGFGEDIDLGSPLGAAPRLPVDAPLLALPFGFVRPGEFETDKPKLVGRQTVITGRFRDWQQHFSPVVITFDADWLVRRGLGTCYLQLPELAGALTVLSAQEAVGKASETGPTDAAADEAFVSSDTGLTAIYDERLQTSRGQTVLRVGENDLLSEISEPAPSGLNSGQPAWTCTALPVSVAPFDAPRRGGEPDLLLSPANVGGAYSAKGVEETFAERPCGAVAVLAQANEGILRDLVLLIAGAFFSLGATLLVEQLLDPRREDPTQAAED